MLESHTPGSLPNMTITCKNSQGTLISANILRLRRYSASFEVYNPYSILQLSEVLGEFRIRISDRIVYSGNAVVNSIVNTGFVLICEVTLQSPWLDIDFLSDRDGTRPLAEQFDAFVEDWKKAHEVRPDFKITVADMQNTLVGLQRWLEQVDVGMRSTTAVSRDKLEGDLITSMHDRMMGEIYSLVDRFEVAASGVSEDRQAVHKFYVRRQVHPLIMCDPFSYRVYNKPLGYAGDYEMVNMILRHQPEGGSLFAKIINFIFLESPPVVAHRNRISYLTGMLRSQAAIMASKGRRLRVLNLGCGPAMEVQRFLRDEELADLCDFTLLDFNEETLTYARDQLEAVRTRGGRSTALRFIQRSVNQLLKQAATGDVDMEWESFDVVYCAGLFDYLSQRVCSRLVEIFYKLLKPGGLLAVTNVSPMNPIRGWMEYILEWNLIYRGDKEMMDLVPVKVSPLPEARLERDVTGVNLFLEIRKPDVANPAAKA